MEDLAVCHAVERTAAGQNEFLGAKAEVERSQAVKVNFFKVVLETRCQVDVTFGGGARVAAGRSEQFCRLRRIEVG